MACGAAAGAAAAPPAPQLRSSAASFSFRASAASKSSKDMAGGEGHARGGGPRRGPQHARPSSERHACPVADRARTDIMQVNRPSAARSHPPARPTLRSSADAVARRPQAVDVRLLSPRPARQERLQRGGGATAALLWRHGQIFSRAPRIGRQHARPHNPQRQSSRRADGGACCICHVCANCGRAPARAAPQDRQRSGLHFVSRKTGQGHSPSQHAPRLAITRAACCVSPSA